MAKPPAKQAAGKVPAAVDNKNQLPDFMRDDAGQGTQDISASDVGTPRLKLIQGTSPELTAYNDLRAGNFFHTAAEHVFSEPFLVVPIYFAKRYLLWNPLEAGGGILARADDAVHWSPPNTTFDVKLDKKDGGHKVQWTTKSTVRESGLAEWGTMNPGDPQSPPAATLMYEYVFSFPEFPDLPPAVFTFQRSSVKNAKNGINDKLKLGRAPIYGRQFQLSNEDDVNGSGQKFFNVRPTAAGFVMDVDLYNQYKELHLMFAQTGIKVADEESLQSEGDGDTNVDSSKY